MSLKMDYSKQQIELLEGKANWSTWRFRALILLRGIKKAVDIIEGRLAEPIAPAADANEAARKTYERDLESYSQAEAMALHVLTSNMSRDILLMVMRFTTAREMWLELNRLFDGGDSVEKLYRVGMEFFGHSPIGDADMATHLSKLKHQFYELNHEFEQNTMPKLPDIVLTMKILNTLPEQYLPFLTSWKMVNKTEQTIDRLTNELCAFQSQLMKKPKQQSGEENEALAVRKAPYHPRSTKEKSTAKPKYKGMCHYCKSEGHFIKQCRKWIADGRPSKAQQQKQVMLSPAEGTNKHSNEALVAEMMMVDSSAFVVENDHNAWYVDNGATTHVTNRRDIFRTFEMTNSVQVKTANGESAPAVGNGTVDIETLVKGKWLKKTLTNVLYVPNIAKNLFSVLAAHDKNEASKFISRPESCLLIVNGQLVLHGTRQVGHGLYKVALRTVIPEKPEEVNMMSNDDLLQLHHERMGHQSKRHIKEVIKEEFGIKVEVDHDTCEGCMYGKAHRLKFGTRERATAPGQLMHADVCGPFETNSAKGYRYFVLFKDDFSRYRYVYFLKEKSEVAAKLEQMLAEISTLGHSVKELLSDNGLELNNEQVKQILSRYGIRQRLVTPYTPQQNGSAERDNRTIVEAARTLLHAHDELPKILWAEMVNTAAYILNRTGVSAVAKKSPYEIWFGKKPAIKHLRVIGTTCYVHVPDQKRRKLDKKAIKCVLIGYDNDDGYRVWHKDSNSVYRSRDVVFDKEKLLKSTHCTETAIGLGPLSADENSSDSDNCTDDEQQRDYGMHGQGDQCKTDRQLRDRSSIKRPAKFEEYIMSAEQIVHHIIEPETYNEAVNCEESAEWTEAMKSEVKSLNENETWTLENLPTGFKAIPCKWVYKVKYNPDDSVNRFKARLVIKGYSQRKGIDYDETFSPVARRSSIRTLISVAANENMTLYQFDVSTAFLYGELNEEIYMQQPDGFNDGSERVCRLRKSLYGLKQAPRCWNRRFGNFLRSREFEQSEADPCVFVRHRGKQKVIIALYVDDGLVAATSKEEAEVLIDELTSEFKVTAKEASYFLGLEINQSSDGIKISQGSYTRKLLQRFRMDGCRSTSTPIIAGTAESGKAALRDEHPDKNADNVDEKQFSYRSAVGGLLYLSTGCRPDIAYAVSVASRSLENPTSDDFIKVKRIFRYLQGTTDHGIVYQPDYKMGFIECYSDADHGGDHSSGRSTTGVICLYSGGAISWLSQKQASVAISTTESEIVAASEAAREVVWIKRLLSSMTSMKGLPRLQVDNEAAVKLAHNPELHRRTKHIQIRHFFVREMVTDGEIQVTKVSSELQLADMLTKPLHKPRLESLNKQIGLQ
jgi:transposase InsO family protein